MRSPLFFHFPASAALAVLGLLAGAAPGPAQGEGEDDPYLPGLVGHFRDGKGTTIERIDPQLAFHWKDESPDPRLAGRDFRATWRGHLFALDRGDYRFFVFGSGEVELKVGGKAVLARKALRNEWHESAPVALPGDYVPIELSFVRTEKDARLAVFWSGPQFGLEPIPPRFLFHARERTPGADFERGRLLARVLRCGHCHGGEPAPPGPALDRLAGNLSRGWLIRWLAEGHPPKPADPSPRRMPAFGLSAAQAEVVADWLLTSRGPDRPAIEPNKQPPKKRKKAETEPPSGERLFLTIGCLACHSWRDSGAGGWLGGGDLTHIADKRPPGFFAQWLADPARLNADHRMPVFALSDEERHALALFLSGQKSKGSKPDFARRNAAGEGKKVIEAFRCAACHRLPADAGEAAREKPQLLRSLSERSDWQNSCLGAADSAKQRPGYRLEERDARAVRRYYAGRRSAHADGRLLLAELNCLACHAREGTRKAVPLVPPLLADKLTALGQRYPDLAPQLPALTPPALNSVGDKLTDHALTEVIARRGDPHRPYLQVRMPRFALRDEELKALVEHLVDADRVPPRNTAPADRSRQDRFVLAGGRLLSSDGFGCTSCHAVGGILPPPAPLNTRGPDLSRLDRRIRREWYDRWMRNPARIVPRMEMPSVQLPVSGVLDNNLDDQLAAVWHVLNLPGFEPPAPNPVRTLRHTGQSPGAGPLVITDLVHHGKKVMVRPFLVGLANRHNVLLDLETGGLALWTAGDTARQRTRGKSWFWELAGATVLETGIDGPDLTLLLDGREMVPRALGQFVTEADAWQTEGPAVVLDHRLSFQGAEPRPVTVQVRRKFAPLAGDGAGFVQELSAGPMPSGARLRLRVLSPKVARTAALAADGKTLNLGGRFATRIVLREPADAKFTADGTVDLPAAARVVLHHLAKVPIDRFPETPPQPEAARKAEPLEVAPGFTGERLPLPADIMPTGLTWRPDGRLVFCSLKGQVFEAADSDGDGVEDRLLLLADGLPAPYGVHAGSGHVDVSAKFALLRIHEAGGRIETIASGWGYTDDYHDWAVGLPRNGRGEYFLGIPCQQDKRPAAGARFHGSVLKLVPRRPTADNPRQFDLEPLSAGHRFPMGLALDRGGELFVTDNQGNYKPFNELNHVRPGAHFGFVNTLDRGKPVPPRMPPAIAIPHPWTRSVNGIGFLYTPKGLRATTGRDFFGPLEGHLVGCEYDTRRLVRMTLQRVGDTYQGAAYPLSVPPADPARGLLGPLVCAVSPRGELYVGGIRDSGWGAGNNVGEIVRIKVDPDKLPCGIAEVRATRDGFVIDFFRPIDRELAGRADRYAIQSYRREATPAYGGPDLDRRTEKVTAVVVAGDARRVTVKLAELRPGFVYEFRLKDLAPGGGAFYPAAAHYTLRAVPR